jgi:hypothetical protein
MYNCGNFQNFSKTISEFPDFLKSIGKYIFDAPRCRKYLYFSLNFCENLIENNYFFDKSFGNDGVTVALLTIAIHRCVKQKIV